MSAGCAKLMNELHALVILHVVCNITVVFSNEGVAEYLGDAFVASVLFKTYYSLFRDGVIDCLGDRLVASEQGYIDPV